MLIRRSSGRVVEQASDGWFAEGRSCCGKRAATGTSSLVAGSHRCSGGGAAAPVELFMSGLCRGLCGDSLVAWFGFSCYRPDATSVDCRISAHLDYQRGLGGETTQKGGAVYTCCRRVCGDRDRPTHLERCTGGLRGRSMPDSGHRLESDIEAVVAESCSVEC